MAHHKRTGDLYSGAAVMILTLLASFWLTWLLMPHPATFDQRWPYELPPAQCYNEG